MAADSKRCDLVLLPPAEHFGRTLKLLVLHLKEKGKKKKRKKNPNMAMLLKSFPVVDCKHVFQGNTLHFR